MQYMGTLSGSSPVIKKYQASAAMIAGIVVLASAANASGQMSVSTTTSMAEALGLHIDLGSKPAAGGPTAYTTTQSTIATDGVGVGSVIVNPDQIIRAHMVTGATGTSITGDTIVTAASNGLTTVGSTSVASPDMDEGTVWYTSGSNVGQHRKITSTSSATATVIVPFAANAVGDTFAYIAQSIGIRGWTLNTALDRLRVDVATTTACRCVVLDLELNGTSDSYAQLLLTDMAWNPIGA